MIKGSGEGTEPEWVVIENPSVPDIVRQVVLAAISVSVVIGLAVAAIIWH